MVTTHKDDLPILYETKDGVIHFCEGDRMVPYDPDTFILWTACEIYDVPPNAGFVSRYVKPDCPDCLARRVS